MARVRRPTQSDIARAAGVSPAVVSLVINGRTDGKIRISAETQARVRQAVVDLGYVPNLAARQLAGGHNHLLGVFTYEPAFPLNASNFYYPFLVGIEEQAETLGYDLLLFTRSAKGAGQRQVYRDGINALQAADGAVLLGTKEDRNELARLQDEGFPFVFVGRREINGQPTAYVGADYESAAAEMIEHLADLGHVNILYLADQGNLSESGMDREAGILRGMKDAQIDRPEERMVRTRISAITPEQVAAWLEDGVTAIVTQSLLLAHAVIREAGTIDQRPPHAFSIAALGNSDDTIIDDGSVTSIQIPRRQMGAGAVQLLVKMLYHPDDVISRQLLLECTLTHGESVGHPTR